MLHMHVVYLLNVKCIYVVYIMYVVFGRRFTAAAVLTRRPLKCLHERDSPRFRDCSAQHIKLRTGPELATTVLPSSSCRKELVLFNGHHDMFVSRDADTPKKIKPGQHRTTNGGSIVYAVESTPIL